MKRLVAFALLAASCVAVSAVVVPARAGEDRFEVCQYYPPQPQQPYYYDQHERERMKHERWEENQWRKEEKRRMKEQYRAQQWYNDQWRWHNQRYFGAPIAPYAGESYESYSRRVRQQCNIQWNNCATYCNTIRDPNRRAACVANCNNDLYQCQAAF